MVVVAVALAVAVGLMVVQRHTEEEDMELHPRAAGTSKFTRDRCNIVLTTRRYRGGYRGRGRGYNPY